jgi:ribosomal-protein-alanine N-acetyltransferase
MHLADLPLAIEPMRLVHVAEVVEIEREAFSLPWPESAYRYEVTQNELAHYYILCARPDSPLSATTSSWQRFWQAIRHGPGWDRGTILGYGGFWLMYDDAHISTLSVRARYRRLGLGELLLLSMLEAAQELGGSRATLEVRVSNKPAQALYDRYGFEQVGRRKAYYQDNREDALILTTPDFDTPNYQDLLHHRRRELMQRLIQTPLDKILQMH